MSKFGGGNDRSFSTGKIAAFFRDQEAQRQSRAARRAASAREARETEAARKRVREAERLRKGRSASILTSGRGETQPLGTANRPRASALLGG